MCGVALKINWSSKAYANHCHPAAVLRGIRQKGAYNRQEVGLARAFAALGCRAVVLYPDPDAAPEAVTSEDLEPNVRIYYVPARKAGVSAFTVPGSRC